MATPVPCPSGYFIQIKVLGRRESATFRTKREAQLWAERRKLELRAEAKGLAGEIKTLRDAMRRFAEEEAPKRKGGRWEVVRLAMMESDGALPITKPLARLTADDFTDWKRARLAKVSEGSVLREMSLLGSVLTTARREWRWMQHKPLADVARPRQPAHRDRIITWSEIRIMLRTLGYSPRERPTTLSAVTGAVFLVALRTGMRMSEITGLTWGRVHGSWVNLPDTKNGQRRDVPMPPKTGAVVQRMRGLHDEQVFPVASQTVDALFRKARDRAGLSGFRFHDSRHTAATRIGRTVGQPGRLSFVEFCKVFGWRDPKHALIYVNPTASDLAQRM